MLVVLFSVLIFLFSGLCRAPSQQRQWACPGRSNHAHIRSVFVDSGAFPDGIYREHDAFMTLNTSTTTRICGLFSSSSPSGSGDVSMWVPAVHPTLGRAWRHLLIPQQLHSPRASQSLFSTRAADVHLQAVPFLSRHAHCLVLPDDWVVPLSTATDGIFLDTIFSGPDACPDDNLLPAYCVFQCSPNVSFAPLPCVVLRCLLMLLYLVGLSNLIHRRRFLVCQSKNFGSGA